MATMNHPAAEIVAIALRKIRKVANNRKFAKLTDACKEFLDNIQIIIPPLPEGVYAGAKTLTTSHSNAGLSEQVTGQDYAASEPGSPPSSPSRRASQDGALSRLQHATSAHSSVAVSTGGEVQGDANAAAGGEGSATVSRVSSAAQLGPGEGASTGDAATATTPAQVQAAQSSVTDSTTDAASNMLDEYPELAARTETALPLVTCRAIVDVMRLAVETQRPDVIEIALDCIQKLIAFRFLQGSVYAINADKPGKDSELAAGT